MRDFPVKLYAPLDDKQKLWSYSQEKYKVQAQRIQEGYSRIPQTPAEIRRARHVGAWKWITGDELTSVVLILFHHRVKSQSTQRPSSAETSLRMAKHQSCQWLFSFFDAAWEKSFHLLRCLAIILLFSLQFGTFSRTEGRILILPHVFFPLWRRLWRATTATLPAFQLTDTLTWDLPCSEQKRTFMCREEQLIKLGRQRQRMEGEGKKRRLVEQTNFLDKHSSQS